MFGRIAQTAAYNGGEEWLDALRAYLAGTRDLVESFLRDELPEFSCSHLEATYLMWLDCSALGMEQQEARDWFAREAGVGLTSGTAFGVEGTGFMRMNIATPRKNVVRALEQIKAAVRAR